jgi:hypothetical protein
MASLRKWGRRYGSQSYFAPCFCFYAPSRPFTCDSDRAAVFLAARPKSRRRLQPDVGWIIATGRAVSAEPPPAALVSGPAQPSRGVADEKALVASIVRQGRRAQNEKD